MPVIIGEIKLYSLHDLSEMLSVTEVTLRSYIAKGKIKARKMGGKFLISEDALKEYFLTYDNDNLTKQIKSNPNTSNHLNA